MKRLLALSLVLVLCIPSVVNAEETKSKIDIEATKIEDNAPAIGKFVAEEKYQSAIKLKEKKAKEYYDAKISGAKGTTDLLLEFAEMTGADSSDLATVEAGTKSQYQDRVISVPQKDQDTYYWCGYAAMQSILSHKGISMSQADIADEAYMQSTALPWYFLDWDDRSEYPAATTLDDLTGYYYCPYPYEQAGTGTVTTSDLANKVCASIDLNYGVMACGISKKSLSDDSHFPGYPTYKDVGHWVVVRGYYEYGDEYAIADPAKSSEVTWSGSINAYYSVDDYKLAAYSSYKGIIW